jgi:hypothetical protein
MFFLPPPQPILPRRTGAGTGHGPHLGVAQPRADGIPKPILPAQRGLGGDVGQRQAMPQPILPKRSLATAGGRGGGVIQGAFPGGRPRVPVRAPRPGHKGAFQLKPAAPLGNATSLPDDFAGVRSFSPGKKLPQAIQAKMESLFGTSFADVRIHEGPEASSIGALAFTQGSSIYFAFGQYNPNTAHGQRLLGQQLAHVVQQRSGRVRNPFGAGTAVVHDPLFKAEAEMMGARAAMAGAVQPRGQSGPQVGHLGQIQPPAPILPGRPQVGNSQAQASPAMPRPLSPGPALQPSAMPAPILPGRASSPLTAGPAIQPKMSLAAIVARGRDMFTSAVTQVGRKVFGL